MAFVGTMSEGDEIYTIPLAGGDPLRLTFNTWEWDKHPTWSPDGTQIAFFSNRETGRRQIWLMNADGSDQRNLSNNEYEDWDPVWVR
jgi:TolB protein